MGVLADADRRWRRGRKEYRRADEPFVGDPLMEAYDEMLDGLNYQSVAYRKQMIPWWKFWLAQWSVYLVAALLRAEIERTSFSRKKGG